MADIQLFTDEHGKIDKAYYKNALIDTINQAIEQYNYDPKHITANHLNACLTKCRHTFFEADQVYISNPNANPMLYTTDNIKSLFTIYIEIAEIFNCIPSLYGFYRLTGIQEDTTQQYLTPVGLEILKSRKEYIQNKLADSTLGVTVLANNDSSVGLMYTAQNQIRQETIKQGLGVDNLPKLTGHGTT